jgi:tetratricopeptide (TPR) repeat protein
MPEAEYRKVLAVAPGHVESLMGLAEVLTSLGDSLRDEDRYRDAEEYLSQAIETCATSRASKRLPQRKLARIYYSRGYVTAKRCELSKALGDQKTLLPRAAEDFNRAETMLRYCCENESDHLKARRASEKLRERLGPASPQRVLEVYGPLTVCVTALVTFLLSQVGNHYSGTAPRGSKPHERTFQGSSS